MTTKEYVEACNVRNWGETRAERKKFNLDLIQKYPFLKPFNELTGEEIEDYNFEFTILDDMPDGWRIAFGDSFMEELKEELDKFNYSKAYRVAQVKEKFGGLRWYDNGCPQGCKVDDIIRKYEDLSFNTCIICGKPAKYVTTGWIIPLCESCAKECREKGEHLNLISEVNNSNI